MVLALSKVDAAEKIAFIRFINGDVPKTYLMEPDGSQQTRLIDDLTPELFPAGSPDGRTIVLFRYPNGINDTIGDLFTVGIDGANLRNLTNLSAAYMSPQWSPDGKRIAFTANIETLPSGPRSLYVMDADGGNRTMLTRFATGGGMTHLTWSPDGRLIAYIEDHAIWVVSSAGGQAVRLTGDLHPEDVAWSPDGKWIAFYPYPAFGDDSTPLYVLNTQTNEQRLVTREGFYIGGVTWSPDSRKLVFGSYRPKNILTHDIFSVELDGSNLTNLTESPEYDRDPSWFGYRPLSVSPLGKRAASWGWLKGLGQ